MNVSLNTIKLFLLFLNIINLVAEDLHRQLPSYLYRIYKLEQDTSQPTSRLEL